MNKKITIEKLNNGWLLEVDEGLSLPMREAYESSGNLMVAITAALAGSASRLDIDNKDVMTIRCKFFK